MGLYEMVKFTKIIQDSTNLHGDKLHPQCYLQGDGLTH
jgi:hypothetical protein